MIKVPPTKNDLLRIDLESIAQYVNSGGTTASPTKGLVGQLVVTDFELRIVLEDLAQFAIDWVANGGGPGGSGGAPPSTTLYGPEVA